MNIGDLLRPLACAADEAYIELTGRPLTHLPTGAHLRGFYKLPIDVSRSEFGIDSPDEMVIELGFNTTIRKLRKLPAFKDILVDCIGGSWEVAIKARNDDIVRGQNRLILNVVRHQESLVTGGKQDVEHHQRTL